MELTERQRLFAIRESSTGDERTGQTPKCTRIEFGRLPGPQVEHVRLFDSFRETYTHYMHKYHDDTTRKGDGGLSWIRCQSPGSHCDGHQCEDSEQIGCDSGCAQSALRMCFFCGVFGSTYDLGREKTRNNPRKTL